MCKNITWHFRINTQYNNKSLLEQSAFYKQPTPLARHFKYIFETNTTKMKKKFGNCADIYKKIPTPLKKRGTILPRGKDTCDIRCRETEPGPQDRMF